MNLVRAAKLPDDAPAIAAIDTAFTTTTVYRVEVSAEAIALREETLRSPLTKRLPLDDLDDPARPWTSAWAAEDDARLVGFAAAARSSWSGRMTLWHLYVDPAHRGAGVGRRLVEAVMAAAKESGADHLWLETSNLNAPAVAFYRRMGFALCGVDTLLYAGTPAEGEVALFMARKVT